MNKANCSSNGIIKNIKIYRIEERTCEYRDYVSKTVNCRMINSLITFEFLHLTE